MLQDVEKVITIGYVLLLAGLRHMEASLDRLCATLEGLHACPDFSRYLMVEVLLIVLPCLTSAVLLASSRARVNAMHSASK